MGISPIAEAVTGAISPILDFVGRFFPDKTQAEKDQAALAIQELVSTHAEAAAQIAVDQAEASSPDRINHWRGALGWTCDVAIGWHFIGLPVFQYFHAVLMAWGWTGELPDIPDVDQMPLMQLVLLMLGSHAVPAITGAIASLKK